MYKKIITCLLPILLFAMFGCAGKYGENNRFIISAPGIFQDTHTGRMWQLKKTVRFKSFEEANAFAEKLTLGGYNDWRLPTIYELYDLNFLFDLHKNGDIFLDREGNYWSGEKDGVGMIGAWAISDQCEPERRYETGKTGYVRAVRP